MNMKKEKQGKFKHFMTTVPIEKNMIYTLINCVLNLFYVNIIKKYLSFKLMCSSFNT